MDIEQIHFEVEKYKSIHSHLDEYRIQIYGLMGKLLNLPEINIDRIESRTKSIDSFKEKITRVGKNYTNPLLEITDLIAFRIIVAHEDDILAVENILKAQFRIDVENSKDTSLPIPVKAFGYKDIHIIATIDDYRALLIEWVHAKDLRFEIQIRTIAQHAWATISHDLYYKIEHNVPSTEIRRLNRIAVLLELADEEFSDLRRLRKATPIQTSKETITTASINHFSEYSSISARCNAYARVAGFIVNQHSNDEYWATKVLYCCKQLGIDDINSLESFLLRMESKIPLLFKEVVEVEKSRGNSKWGYIPLFGIILTLLGKIPDFGEQWLKDNDLVALIPHTHAIQKVR